MPKSISIEIEKKINIQQLWKKLSLLQIDSLKYVMLVPTGVSIHFKDGSELSEQDEARIKECVDLYEIYPDVNDIRRMREPLLREADWRINRAQDNNEDISLLVTYRKALRDITNNYDNNPVEWPIKPW